MKFAPHEFLGLQHLLYSNFSKTPKQLFKDYLVYLVNILFSERERFRARCENWPILTGAEQTTGETHRRNRRTTHPSNRPGNVADITRAIFHRDA